MAEMTYIQAISDALRLEMRRDPRVFVLGEDVGVYGGAFKVTHGFQEEFGASRVLDMRDLRKNGVDVVTIGQYLQPSSGHAKIDRWVHPDEFRWMREQGEALGFGSVFAGPLVRSSYRADEQRHAAETGLGAVSY